MTAIITKCVMIAAVAHFLAPWGNDLQEGLRTNHFFSKICLYSDAKKAINILAKGTKLRLKFQIFKYIPLHFVFLLRNHLFQYSFLPGKISLQQPVQSGRSNTDTIAMPWRSLFVEGILGFLVEPRLYITLKLENKILN